MEPAPRNCEATYRWSFSREAGKRLLYFAQSNFAWSRWSELNRQPIAYEAIALPVELHRPV